MLPALALVLIALQQENQAPVNDAITFLEARATRYTGGGITVGVNISPRARLRVAMPRNAGVPGELAQVLELIEQAGDGAAREQRDPQPARFAGAPAG